MNHRVKKITSSRTAIGIVIAASIVFMLNIELGIQLFQHRRDVSKSSDLLLNQIVEKIVKNDISEITLAADLRAEYIITANAVAYIIQKNPVIENDMDELVKLCRIFSIDEIHFFDDKGTIYGGTHPAYYGMSFDSGDQIGYFKPMLTSKGMSMCQDPTPNTAEGRSMIYAIVWKKDGTGMIQIGVTPHRYIREIQENAIPRTIAEIPLGEGSCVFVADRESGKIIGASNVTYVNKTLSQAGITLKNKPFFKTVVSPENGKRYKAYCRIRNYKSYSIGLLESRKPFRKILIVTALILLVYLCFAASLIVLIMEKTRSKLQDERDMRLSMQESMLKSLQEQLSIINGVGGDFADIVLVNIKNRTASMLKKNGETISYDIAKQSNGTPYEETWDTYIKKHVVSDDAEKLRGKVQMEHILKELDAKSDYYCTYRCHFNGDIINLQAKFMKIKEVDSDSNYFFFAIRNINGILEEQRRFAMLEKEAKLDRLTGFQNRSAYEDDINNKSPKFDDENMIYFSMDVNGLKQVNDNFGHAKGDELLRGAASCMNMSFGSYGKLYRTGGDEFCAIIYTDSENLEKILKDFDEAVAKWSAEHKLDLTVSIGCAKRKENKDATMMDLSRIADKAMYCNKALFYKTRGIDRRSEYRFSGETFNK